MAECIECGSFYSGWSCDACRIRNEERSHSDRLHRERMDALERAGQQAEDAARAGREQAEQHHREQIRLEEDRIRAEAEREEQRQKAQAEREEQRQIHAEELERERQAHQERLAAEERRQKHHYNLRRNRFGKARDDLDIAISQRSLDLAGAESTLQSALAQWPLYPWAWLELAELLRQRHAPAEAAIERACEAALVEGVWMLAPDRPPPALRDFATRSLKNDVWEFDATRAPQACFLVRLVQLNPPSGRLTSLLDAVSVKIVAA